ncbi:DUF547 domain-containing protein [Leptospira sarikeiensis]|uniref:DUF547 domain-containing protein n=1 Tax=Leptospira sarikeiensis TaxID=2484943 RepID=UPI0014383DC5|nr:DUF547 domain-containing protein [Leptospira sarikeiensis]
MEWFRVWFYPPQVSQTKKLDYQFYGESFSHIRYERILKRVVDKKGKVDYKKLSSLEKELDIYISELKVASLEKYSSPEKLALFINAYNSFTLKLMLEWPNARSIQEIPKIKRWEDPKWNLANNKISLYTLEHKWIRENFSETLIHFALVCASNSCPGLKNTAYTGQNLKKELEEQARLFLKDPKNIRLDLDKNILSVSEIFDWYREDFGKEEGSVMSFILKYLDDMNLREELEKRSSKIRFEYIPYDWGKNDSSL